MTRRWLAAAMMSLLVLVSCGGVSTSSRAEPERSDTHRRSEPSPPEITIVDSGAEPRRELRLELAEGSEHPFTMEMMQNQQLHIDGRAAGPAVEVTFALDTGATVVSVTDGVAEVEMTYQDVRVTDPGSLRPSEASEFETIMQGFVGLTFLSTIDDRGTTLTIDIPRDFPDLGPEFQQMIDEFEVPSLPLPVEAVGVGARWTVESMPAAYVDMPMPTVTEYELVELHDDRFVVHQRATATVEPSVMESGRTTAEFHGGEIVTEGTMTWSFDSLHPFGEYTSEGSIRFSESDGSQSVDGELFQRARLAMRPLD